MQGGIPVLVNHEGISTLGKQRFNGFFLACASSKM
jgi:hypothetical protein